MARKQHQNANGDKLVSPAVDVCTEGDAVIVRIPVKFYRWNGRQMVLADPEGTSKSTDSSLGLNGTLIGAIARAHQWQKQLESGEYESLEDLATAHNVGRTYVARVLRLALLCPSIVEDIIAGKENEMTLRKLHKGFPFDWCSQREMSGSYRQGPPAGQF